MCERIRAGEKAIRGGRGPREMVTGGEAVKQKLNHQQARSRPAEGAVRFLNGRRGLVETDGVLLIFRERSRATTNLGGDPVTTKRARLTSLVTVGKDREKQCLADCQGLGEPVAVFSAEEHENTGSFIHGMVGGTSELN